MSRIVVLRKGPAEPLGDHVLALRDLGHDVHLLAGAATAVATEPHEVDGVTVQTAPVRPWLGPGSNIARSPRWTRPFGYRLLVRAKTREAAARARVAEARFRRDVALVRTGSVPATARLRLLLARAHRRWVAERAEDTREAYALRRGRQRAADKAGRRWWRLTSRRHAWAHLDPALLDPEIHLGPLLDELEADAIHAEGAVMMSVAVRAAARRNRPVAVVWDRTTDRKPRKPWVAEARKLLVAEYRGRVDQTVKRPTRHDLATAYAAVGLASAPSDHLEGTP